VPATLPEPSAPTTLLPAPSVSLLPLGLVSLKTSKTQPDDMVMSLPMTSPPQMKVKVKPSNQAFAHMFPKEPYTSVNLHETFFHLYKLVQACSSLLKLKKPEKAKSVKVTCFYAKS
jgi:hypothetical protein